MDKIFAIQSRLLLMFSFLISSIALTSQVKTAPEGYQFFEMESGDSTIIMKQYFICFLKSGPNRNQSKEQAEKIQEKHLAHLASLYYDGYTCATGPFGNDGEIKGIIIFKTATLMEAEKLAKSDPAVISGRLIVEILPWWARKGSVLD